ncbi:SDR family oxidoreductase [Nocardiopsis sp. JB363]|uniref:SDR family oxidoreductase n=1 Tax=Nocardiopsis sp. JB363 TaxID=1434837 RepID=UPI00097A9BBA|nr:SDR family oxidoreductase [Nocardiopsis sp. JB363]SIO84105.1 Short-chain dehydrogenase/reductase SDR [Nocardiopsis sp. JB363]
MSHMEEPDEVVVVTGAGGMGEAIARRLGNGRRLVLADYSRDRLDQVVAALRETGYSAKGVLTDVSDRSSVEELARVARREGRIVSIVHTAGVSAATATTEAILKVDLVGTAHVIDVFETVAARGTSLVCVASMAGHHASLSTEDEHALATAPAEDLLSLDAVKSIGDGISAYIVAKRANQVRVQAAALAWNRRGARLNTISPGVIATPMAAAEAEAATGEHMTAMVHACGIGRSGTPGEIAEAAAFLAGPDSRYITGTDLLVDGGQAAWIRHHRPTG